ncbi:hypothetical protein CDAR_409011 [Caerostris darwini]|uniref:Uncharacterized protein n=1 Tax=Caerostris darwini TaxID=1538125 RepID=A0AAV4P8V1_9ARAC|nr:hypothetical protein CDAR_409011 [Caerostris darwini]
MGTKTASDEANRCKITDAVSRFATSPLTFAVSACQFRPHLSFSVLSRSFDILTCSLQDHHFFLSTPQPDSDYDLHSRSTIPQTSQSFLITTAGKRRPCSHVKHVLLVERMHFFF